MKYLFLSLAIFVSVCSVKAQSGSYENDFKLVRTSIINYFTNVAENAYNFAPGGIDASNGYLNEKMNCKYMNKLADPLDEYKFYSNLGSGFYEMFYTFSLQNQRAFKETYKSDEDYEVLHFQHKVLSPCIKCNRDHLMEVADHIIGLFLPPEKAKPILEHLGENVLNLYTSVNHNNNSSVECHATGAITKSIHNAALEALEKLNDINVNNRASAAGRVGMVMSHCYEELLELPVQEDNTWLSAEWQIGYYTIMYATYMEIKAMEFYPNSTSYLDYAAKYKK